MSADTNTLNHISEICDENIFAFFYAQKNNIYVDSLDYAYCDSIRKVFNPNNYKIPLKNRPPFYPYIFNSVSELDNYETKCNQKNCVGEYQNDTIYNINIYTPTIQGEPHTQIFWKSNFDKYLIQRGSKISCVKSINRPKMFFDFIKIWQPDSLDNRYCNHGIVHDGANEWICRIIIRDNQIIEIRAFYARQPNYNKR